MASWLKVLLFSRRCDMEKVRSGGEIVILGNGPSLLKTIEEKRGFLAGKDLMTVNFAVASDYFERLKPRFHIATDPLVYTDPAQCEKLFGALAAKVDWQLCLFIPCRYRKTGEWAKIVESNPRITPRFINITPVTGNFALCLPLYKGMLGMPRPHNVLIPALMASVWMGYKKIYTAGVDHSWHMQLRVADNNALMINDTHFYDTGTDTDRRHGNFTMTSLFRQLYTVFSGYHTVERFARRQGTKVYNITEGSFIDAFERLKV